MSVAGDIIDDLKLSKREKRWASGVSIILLSFCSMIGAFIWAFPSSQNDILVRSANVAIDKGVSEYVGGI